MANIPIRNVGRIGMIKDQLPHELPPEAWTRVQNVDFNDGFIERCKGEIQVEGDPDVPPYYLYPSPSDTSAFWVYTDLDDVYAVAGGTHTEITRAAGVYTGDIDDKWNGGWLNGVLITNNGVDDPQQWLPISTGQLLVALSNWPASTKARVIRPFQEFLMAMYVTKSGTVYPTMVKWSTPADPGSVPASWDETDATNISGELPIGETPGFIVDGCQLGQSFMVYKEDAIVRMDRIATNDIFSRRFISTETGLMAIDCVKEFIPGQQIALTMDADVIVTDGQQVRSITNEVIRNHLAKYISGEHRDRCFVVTNQKTKRAWICYPRVGSAFCRDAVIWNWQDNTWSMRDISDTLQIAEGIYDQDAISNAWDDDTETWAEDDTTWDERTYIARTGRLLGAFPLVDSGNGQIRELEQGRTLGGDAGNAVLEREGLAIIGQDRQGQPRVDTRVVKQVTAVYPLIRASHSTTIRVSIGAQDHPNGPTTWDGPYDFDPTTDERVDCFVEGRFISIRFSTLPGDLVPWKMYGYNLDLDVVGEFF